MKKRILWLRYLFIFLAFASASVAYAQEITVTGKVKDAADGSAIPGATVLVKGTTTGTVTDIDGKYSIQVQSVAILVFSYMGYQTQEISVAGKQVIDVSLAASVTSLNELVVIGYGQVKKQDLTGAVTAVDRKDFDQGAISSPQE
jgi:iron complex outermembrane receptor protein